MDRITIELNGWREYQHRSDLKSMTWFRVDRDIFDGETYHELGNDGIMVFLYLLTQAAKKNNPVVVLSIKYASSKLGIKISSVKEAIEKLKLIQILHEFVTDAVRIDTSSCTQTDRQTEQTLQTEQTDRQTDCTELAVITDQSGCLPKLNLHNISTSLFKTVSIKTQEAWLSTYPNAQWICHEALKANIWMLENPKKKPKQFGKFFSNWLSNGYEDYRKGIPSNSKNKTFVQQAAESNERIRQQLQKEIDQEENERETNHDDNN